MGDALACDPDPASVLGSVLAALDSNPPAARTSLYKAGEWDEAFASALARLGLDTAQVQIPGRQVGVH
jgi:hypothetical protein